MGHVNKTTKVLLTIFDAIDDFGFLYSHRSLSMRMGVSQARSYLNETERLKKKNRQTFYRLRKQGLIRDKKIGDKMISVLSDSGVVSALKIRMHSCKKKMPHDRLCLIVFDFPKSAKNSRNRLRVLIRKVGFKYEQRSVWWTNKDIGSDLGRLIKLLKIEKWVHIFIGTRI